MIFTIQKGAHHSDGFLHKLRHSVNTSLYSGYEVIFDESCLYDLGTSDQRDINKLFGFSAGSHHHRESARWGWVANGGLIELWSYCYVGGERRSEFICSILPGESYELELVAIPTHYLFCVSHRNEVYEKGYIPKDPTWKFGYNLWPYFGGNRTAPHDMRIFLGPLSTPYQLRKF